MNFRRSRTQTIIRYFDAQPYVWRYGLAVLAVAIGTAATYAIPAVGERSAFLLFFFGIIQTAFWLGLKPGILAMALSLIAVNTFVLFPAGIDAYDIAMLNAGYCFASVCTIATTNIYRRSTAELLESRQDLDYAQKVGQIGSWRLNVKGDELRWSGENYRIFGIAQGAPLTYESFLSIVHPDDREYVDKRWQAALRGEPYEIEHRLIVAGEVKWVREKAVLEFGKKGNLLGGFGITQDITSYKRNELALQESRQRYAAIVESALDAIITVDSEQRITLFNAAAEKMFVCTAEEAIGKPLERFIPARFRSVHQAQLRAFGSTGATSRKMGESAFISGLRANGEEFPAEATISQCEINGEQSFTAIMRDVTDRKRAETALRDRENELRLIMDATPALIAYLDTDFRYLRINAAYPNWFRMAPESILGREVREIIGDEAWTIVQPYLERARSGEKASFDKAVPYVDGNPRWVHGTYIPDRDAAGAVKGIVVHIVDIEEIKQAERQINVLNQHLQQRIEEMQVIFNTAPIGLSIADDPAGCRIRGNWALEEMLGLAPGSELSMRNKAAAAICVSRNGRGLTVDEMPMQRAIRGETVTQQIMDITRPDGRVITVLSNASPLFDEKGLPRGAVGAFLDITELKRFEDSLTKSQAQLRTFIEQAPLSIAMFDREMNYLVTSRRWVEEFGRGYDDLTGYNHYVVNPDISAEWKQVHAKAQAGEFLKNDDDLWLQADGSRRWVRWAAYPWTNQEGAIGGIIISCEDITARRTAEEELRTAQTRLALVVEEVNAGYWDWDLNADNVYLSPEWKLQLGFADNELLNRREEWESRLHPDDRAWVLEAAEKYIAGLLPVFEMEFRLRHKDGLYRWIHTRGGLLRDHNNRPTRMLGINLDITDYKKQKELRDRREKMEQSVRLCIVTQTAAAIAHELHQPLAAISSYTEVALHMLRAGNSNPEKLSPIMEVCTQQAQRAGGVIRQLMTVLNEDETQYESVDINLLAQEALDLVKTDGHLEAFSLKPDFATDLPPVRGNSLQIEKVLVNLLCNGLESMRESGIGAGSITITTRRAADTPPMVQVTVRDGGKSVTDIASLKHMFQPFYRVKPHGSGMDLAISRALIEAHGGKMWAERNPDTGISIHFTLPVAL
jgi:PAS domain S-box-containing protein